MPEGMILNMKFGQKGLDAYKAQTEAGKKKENSRDAALSALKALDQKASSPEGLLKTGREVLSERRDSRQSGEILKGIAKAARFILLLDKDEAGKVLRNMDEREIELITREIARIQSVTIDEARMILEDFGSSLNPHAARGGSEMARDILTRAFGEEKGLELMRKSVPDSVPAPFDFLNDLSVPQLLLLLKDDTLETLAIILSFMDPRKALGLIKSRPKEEQVLLIKRMGRIDKIDPRIISRMEGLLQERVHKLARVDEVEIDGASRLTEILKHMDPSSENSILRELDDRNPELGRRIREELLTMDSIFKLRPRDLQNLLMNMSNENLVLLLKDKDQEVVDHILSHLSSQRRLILEEEMVLAPLVHRSEVKKVTREFLELIKEKQEQGVYILLDEDEDLLV